MALGLFLLPDGGVGVRQAQGQGTWDTWSQEQEIVPPSTVLVRVGSKVLGRLVPASVRHRSRPDPALCLLDSVWQVAGIFLPSPDHSWVGGQGSTTSPPRGAISLCSVSPG